MYSCRGMSGTCTALGSIVVLESSFKDREKGLTVFQRKPDRKVHSEGKLGKGYKRKAAGGQPIIPRDCVYPRCVVGSLRGTTRGHDEPQSDRRL